MRLLFIALIAVGGCANTLPASEILWIQDAAEKSLGKCSPGSVLPRHTLCPLLNLNQSDVVRAPSKAELRVGVQLQATDDQRLETRGRAAWFFHGPDGAAWGALETFPIPEWEATMVEGIGAVMRDSLVGRTLIVPDSLMNEVRPPSAYRLALHRTFHVQSKVHGDTYVVVAKQGKKTAIFLFPKLILTGKGSPEGLLVPGPGDADQLESEVNRLKGSPGQRMALACHRVASCRSYCSNVMTTVGLVRAPALGPRPEATVDELERCVDRFRSVARRERAR